MKYSGIGGQAVMEGIMMRNGKSYAVAVRKPDGEIEVMEAEAKDFAAEHAWAKWPLIRGVVSFIDSLVLGMSTLMWSASFEETAETDKKNDGESEGKKTEEKKAEEKNADKKNDGSLSKGEMTLTVILAVLLAVGIFMVLPTVLIGLLKRFIDSEWLLALLEGLLRLALFIGYVAGISLMKDIKRTYMYHGSEHKCINCIEHNLPLTVENVMKSSKEHKRCGTSFLIIVMLISVILFMFIRVDNMALRILSRIVLVPVIAGISYEVLRFTGRHDNRFVWIISRPGMWMQALTTKEPTEDMVEVAISAVERVFDWKKWQEENFSE